MDDLRQYIISVIVTAIIVAILSKLLENAHGNKIMKMVTGLVISVVLLSPLGRLRFSSYVSYFDSVDLEAQDAVSYGEELYKDNLRVIIQERCESYILDKASQMNAQICVSIQCDTAEIPVPVYAELSGNVSPYVRMRIQKIITEEIGIPEENQLWI